MITQDEQWTDNKEKIDDTGLKQCKCGAYFTSDKYYYDLCDACDNDDDYDDIAQNNHYREEESGDPEEAPYEPKEEDSW